jgi:hypothetical protein
MDPLTTNRIDAALPRDEEKPGQRGNERALHPRRKPQAAARTVTEEDVVDLDRDEDEDNDEDKDHEKLLTQEFVSDVPKQSIDDLA